MHKAILSFSLLAASVNAFGVDWIIRPPPGRATAVALCGTSGDREEPDLFEYFDPLLSPHAYPDGISPENKPVETKQVQNKDKESSKSSFGFSLNSSSDLEPVSLPTTGQKGTETIDTDDVFDPRISPHAYTNGTPNKVFGFETEEVPIKKVGVLLVDHGSRNSASNERLKKLARVYQDSLNDANTIVRHAHMEIAQPSVPEALSALLEEGVVEIVCHPYFLSPGRHVKEDIPEIVRGAIESLEITIPVVTTEPVGSQTDIMIRAIHASVKKTSVFT
jgi:hypothetical protein